MASVTTRIGEPYALERLTFFTLENLLAGDFSIGDLRQAIDCVAAAGTVQFAVEIGPPMPVHMSGGIRAQSFMLHHQAVDQYIDKVARIGDRCGLGPGWIGGTAGALLTEAIGRPPQKSHPIYFITSETESAKEIVYVGRTAGESGRFVGGHHAITKLHAPQYQGTSKQVYMASVLARISDSEWINMELIKPSERAEFYLSEVELNLIFGLQPALNEDGKTALKAKAAHHVLVQDPYGVVKGTNRITVSSMRR